MQTMDLRQTLRLAVDRWRQVAAVRDLQFSASIEGQDSFVLADESAMRRVIDILLDNAFKYTPSPGSVRLALEQKGASAVIAVQDSGPGIDDEDRSKIFEPFYRIDKARSRELGGAGLGLSIAQWIVAQHRGSIEVESHLGTGSVFYVRLPIVTALVQDPLRA